MRSVIAAAFVAVSVFALPPFPAARAGDTPIPPGYIPEATPGNGPSLSVPGMSNSTVNGATMRKCFAGTPVNGVCPTADKWGLGGTPGTAGRGISSSAVDPATGDLMQSYTDGTTADVGHVVGPAGSGGSTSATAGYVLNLPNAIVCSITNLGNFVLIPVGFPYSTGLYTYETSDQQHLIAFKADGSYNSQSGVIQSPCMNNLSTFAIGATGAANPNTAEAFYGSSGSGGSGGSGGGGTGPAGRGITSAAIDPNSGDLVLTYTDSTTQDVGHVVGTQGPQGNPGTNATPVSGLIATPTPGGTCPTGASGYDVNSREYLCPAGVWTRPVTN